MFKLNNFITLSVILALVGCSGSDSDSLLTIEATVTSSNDNLFLFENFFGRASCK